MEEAMVEISWSHGSVPCQKWLLVPLCCLVFLGFLYWVLPGYVWQVKQIQDLTILPIWQQWLLAFISLFKAFQPPLLRSATVGRGERRYLFWGEHWFCSSYTPSNNVRDTVWFLHYYCTSWICGGHQTVSVTTNLVLSSYCCTTGSNMQTFTCYDESIFQAYLCFE